MEDEKFPTVLDQENFETVKNRILELIKEDSDEYQIKQLAKYFTDMLTEKWDTEIKQRKLYYGVKILKLVMDTKNEKFLKASVEQENILPYDIKSLIYYLKDENLESYGKTLFGENSNQSQVFKGKEICRLLLECLYVWQKWFRIDMAKEKLYEVLEPYEKAYSDLCNFGYEFPDTSSFKNFEKKDIFQYQDYDQEDMEDEIDETIEDFNSLVKEIRKYLDINLKNKVEKIKQYFSDFEKTFLKLKIGNTADEKQRLIKLAENITQESLQLIQNEKEYTNESFYKEVEKKIQKWVNIEEGQDFEQDQDQVSNEYDDFEYEGDNKIMEFMWDYENLKKEVRKNLKELTKGKVEKMKVYYSQVQTDLLEVDTDGDKIYQKCKKMQEMREQMICELLEGINIMHDIKDIPKLQEKFQQQSKNNYQEMKQLELEIIDAEEQLKQQAIEEFKQEQEKKQEEEEQDQNEMKMDKQESDKGYLGKCKICLDKRANHIAMKCKHLVSCENCVKGLKNICPICRQEGPIELIFL